MSMQNYLLLIVAVVLLLPALWGYHRGFLKTVASLLSIVIAMVLVTFLQPYVLEGLQKFTPMETTVEDTIHSVVQSQVQKNLIAQTEDAAYSLTPDAGLEVDLSGMDLSALHLDSWKLSKGMQNHLLEAMELPRVLQGQIETAAETTADAFLENVSGVLSRTVMNTASYLVTFLLVFLLIRILYLVLGIIGRIPVLHGINKILGAVFGLAEGGLILWFLCQAVTAALPSQMGQEIMQAISESPILSTIYNTLFAIGTIL